MAAPTRPPTNDDSPRDDNVVSERVEPGGHVVVALRGEIDLAVAAAVLDRLLSAANRSTARLVVDATGVTFLDSSGINAFVRARDRTAALGGSFHLVATQQVVLRVLELIQLDRALHLVPDVQTALACSAHGDIAHTCVQR